MNITKRFNEKLSVVGTKLFSSIWTFYIFFIWGLLAFLPIKQDWKNIILLISSAWIQLWALPLIAVGSAVLGKASEKRAEQDHKMIKLEFDLMKQEFAEQKEALETARRIETKIDQLLTKKKNN